MTNAKTETVIRIAGGENLVIPSQQIFSVTISKEVNKIPYAHLIIKDGSVERQDFEISNQDDFKPGAPIEILMGTPEDKTIVFKGIVIKHGLKAKKDRPSYLIVECRDESVRMSIGRKSSYWNVKSDSDVFKEIIGKYSGLKVEAEDSSSAVTHNQLVQYYSTDWDFILMRSEAIGQYVFTSDGEIAIGKPKLTEEPILKLVYGEAGENESFARIFDFETEADARHQFSSINTMGWDYSKQEVTSGSNSFEFPQEAGNISSEELSSVIGLDSFHLHHHARMDENELNAFADAVKQKSILSKSRGKVKIEGRAGILPGNMVELSGMGDRFNGKVFVARVHHAFESGRWFTHIQFGLPYAWFHEEPQIQNPPSQGLLPAIKGLHIGKVLQLKDNTNPDKDFRIKVSIPGFHKTNEGVWARYVSPHAGNGRGIVFLPEIDDEVLIGYIGQDSREPVVFGGFYSEVNTPPLENDDNNFKKGIITKNGHKIIIDEEKNIVSIETKGNNKIILDDESGKVELSDTNRNSISMEANGITLKSAAHLNLEAASGQISLNGMSVDIVGNTATTINSPEGGQIRLGNGILPAAALSDIVTGPVGAGVIGPATKNTKVYI